MEAPPNLSIFEQHQHYVPQTGAAEVGGQGGHLPTQFSAKSCNEYLVCERKKLTCNPNCMLDF